MIFPGPLAQVLGSTVQTDTDKTSQDYAGSGFQQAGIHTVFNQEDTGEGDTQAAQTYHPVLPDHLVAFAIQRVYPAQQ